MSHGEPAQVLIIEVFLKPSISPNLIPVLPGNKYPISSFSLHLGQVLSKPCSNLNLFSKLFNHTQFHQLQLTQGINRVYSMVQKVTPLSRQVAMVALCLNRVMHYGGKD